ncbi:glutamine amidotransferase, partial [Candidatus Woesebacteria bacterium]|nr:glutamine amidotransferase [Candidatus Woesebacteria bacterium]
MITAQSLRLIHLFPDKMNIYGDMGNIIALEKRCEWMGIQMEYVTVNKPADFEKIATGDIFFFGGGQDADQMEVWNIIAKEKNRFTKLIEEAVAADKVFLLICGGFQIFGRLFVDGKGNSIPGLGILDVETHAPGDAVSQRCIGNVVIHTD